MAASTTASHSGNFRKAMESYQQRREQIEHLRMLLDCSADYLDAGCYAAAIQGFATCLQKTRRMQQEDQQREEGVRPSSHVVSLDQCMPVDGDSNHPTLSEFCCPSDGSSLPNLPPLKVYHQALRIPRSKNLVEQTPPLSFLCVLCLFNLSTAYLLQALRGEQQQIHRPHQAAILHSLERSQTWLQLAYQLTLEEGLDGGANWFTCATVSNLGIIHLLLGREHTAQECFQHLLTTLVYLREIDAYYPSEQSSSSSVPHQAAAAATTKASCRWSGFWQNTTHLIVRETAAGAA